MSHKFLHCAGPGSQHPLKQDTSVFVATKVLEVFPAGSTRISQAKQPESIRTLNVSASRLLMELLSFYSASTYIPLDLRSKKRTTKNSDSHMINSCAPRQAMPCAGVSAVQQACVSSSQAFAAWTFSREQSSLNAVAACVDVSKAVLSSESSVADPNKFVVCLLKYCRIAIQASIGTGSGGTNELNMSMLQLAEVLTTARRILELVRPLEH